MWRKFLGNIPEDKALEKSELITPQRQEELMDRLLETAVLSGTSKWSTPFDGLSEVESTFLFHASQIYYPRATVKAFQPLVDLQNDVVKKQAAMLYASNPSNYFKNAAWADKLITDAQKALNPYDKIKKNPKS